MEERLNCKKANQSILIGDFLAQQGILPVKVSGNTQSYFSPIREKERTPSFIVNTKQNTFYDFGTGTRGTLIDLAIIIWRCTVGDALSRLESSEIRSRSDIFSFQKPILNDEPSKVDFKIHDLTSSNLIKYLSMRGIRLSVAEKYCKEIVYKVKDKNYYSIAFKNIEGGYETRNQYFKGCIGKKSISIINENSNEVSLFEGFFDMLSAITIWPFVQDNTLIVLNSLTQIDKAISRIHEMKVRQLLLFLDNDPSGAAATEKLKMEFRRSIDISPTYSSHKDVNELLVGSKNGN
jgi:5S rRNA maturation endonuclease (ribonuclease M5)